MLIDKYPHYTTDVMDETITSVRLDEQLPLCRMLFVLPTEMGEPHEVIWVDNLEVFKNTHGKNSFNSSCKKWNTPTSDILKTVLNNSGAFVVRAIEDDAKDSLCLVSLRLRKQGDKLLIGFYIETELKDVLTTIDPNIKLEDIVESEYNYKKTREIFDDLNRNQDMLAFDIKEKISIPGESGVEKWYSIIEDSEILLHTGPYEGVPNGGTVLVV